MSKNEYFDIFVVIIYLLWKAFIILLKFDSVYYCFKKFFNGNNLKMVLCVLLLTYFLSSSEWELLVKICLCANIIDVVFT